MCHEKSTESTNAEYRIELSNSKEFKTQMQNPKEDIKDTSSNE